jgi:preprotein translocase subunit SecG
MRRDVDPKVGLAQMTVVKIGLQVLLVLSSLFLTLLILMHKGKGGGLSDMFGGGISTSLGGSTVAERNLDRFTIAVAVVWFSAVVGLGLLERFAA